MDEGILDVSSYRPEFEEALRLFGGAAEQARNLFILHADADLDYMEKRIRHESAGEYGVAALKTQS